MVTALGLTTDGAKVIPGFVETGTENATTCTAFLRSLVARGLREEEGLLVIIDGSKGLRAAVTGSSDRKRRSNGAPTISAGTSSPISPRARSKRGGASSRTPTRSRPMPRRKPHSMTSARTSGASTSLPCGVSMKGWRRHSRCIGSAWSSACGNPWRRPTCWNQSSAAWSTGSEKWIGGATVTRSSGGSPPRCWISNRDSAACGAIVPCRSCARYFSSSVAQPAVGGDEGSPADVDLTSRRSLRQWGVSGYLLGPQNRFSGHLRGSFFKRGPYSAIRRRIMDDR